jgi:hypothetical protein
MKSQSSTGTSDFTVSSVAGKATFVSTGNDMVDTDTTFYGAYDASGEWEEGVGTWNSGVLERTTILKSSAGGSSKVPFSDQADVVGGMPATVWNSWADPALGTGLLVRDAPNSYATKSIATTVGSLTVDHADGTTGNPTIVDTNVIRRTGGAAAQRTMVDPLILAATETHITGFSGGIHSFKNGAENIMQLVRNAVDDYTINVYGGASPREVVHEDNDGIGSGLDGELIQGHDWSDFHFNEANGAAQKTGRAYFDSNISSPTPLDGEYAEGFQKLPSGITIQFGLVIRDTDNYPEADPVFTFPIPFPSVVMFAMTSVNSYGTPSFDMSAHISALNTTGCTVGEHFSSGPTPANVYSIGYTAFGY